MRQIAIINQKGGVGKTTSCCNVGAAIAQSGHRVLLIDLDPQAHLTMHLGIEPDADRKSIYDVLTDGTPIADATIPVRDRLDLVPSHIDLAAAEMELVSVVGREVVLREALSAVSANYDYVVIDCPPSLGVLTINGLAAVTEVLVPMQPHFLALQGVGKLLESIHLIKLRINPDIRVLGVVLCMYEAGTRLAGEVAADLKGFLEASRGTDKPWAGAQVFESVIRRNIKLAECPSHGQTIFEYEARSNGAADYASLTAEIIGKPVTIKVPAARRQPLPTAEPTPAPAAEFEDRRVYGPDTVESQCVELQPAEEPLASPADIEQADDRLAAFEPELPAPVPQPSDPARIRVIFQEEPEPSLAHFGGSERA